MSSPESPWAARVPTPVLVAVAVAAFLVRWGVTTRLPPNFGHTTTLFGRPWHRPPLLDLLTVPFDSGRQWLAVLLGTLAAVAVTTLAASALPRRGVLAVAAGSVVLPSMVWSGAWWSHTAVVLPLTVLVASALVAVLAREGEGFAAPLAFATWALLLTDWPAWAPVTAWLGWLLVFPPDDIDAGRVKRAAIALGAGVLAALPAYLGLVARGADPAVALSAREVPLGPEAILALLDSVAGVVLGRVRGVPTVILLGVAVAMIAAALLGRRRAIAGGRGAWGDVLAIGSLGAFVPALAAQPWIPVAADKHVWYMGPLVLCLAVSAVFGVRPADPVSPATAPPDRASDPDPPA